MNFWNSMRACVHVYETWVDIVVLSVVWKTFFLSFIHAHVLLIMRTRARYEFTRIYA